MQPINEQSLQLHVTVLGWLYIIGHAFFAIIGAFVFILLTGIGVATGDNQATLILSVVGTTVGVLLISLSVPGVIAGIGLLARKAWARYLAIVVAILGLVNFPIGTVIGVYTLLVLFQESATAYFVPPPATMSTPVPSR
jgi:hypothetical protein